MTTANDKAHSEVLEARRARLPSRSQAARALRAAPQLLLLLLLPQNAPPPGAAPAGARARGPGKERPRHYPLLTRGARGQRSLRRSLTEITHDSFQFRQIRRKGSAYMEESSERPQRP